MLSNEDGKDNMKCNIYNRYELWNIIYVEMESNIFNKNMFLTHPISEGFQFSMPLKFNSIEVLNNIIMSMWWSNSKYINKMAI